MVAYIYDARRHRQDRLTCGRVGVCISGGYYFFLRRASAMPAIPKASSPNVAGSGTELMGGSKLPLPAQALETVSSIRRATADAICTPVGVRLAAVHRTRYLQ